MISSSPAHDRNPQQPSGMPHQRYEPFIPVDLTDRTWPDQAHDARPRAGARSTSATATRP